LRIYLPNSAHLANIGAFLAKLDHSHRDRLEVTIHDRWVSVHPLTLAITAAIAANCRASGGTINANVPTHRSIAYLIRMGLFGIMGVDPAKTITEHEASGRFIPLTQVRTNAELKAALTELVPLLHAPPQVADPIRYVFSEMARNVLEHAMSPVGAFVCAQYYRRSKRIAIGIADVGRGIRKSMAESHNVPTDQDAIRKALQPGMTGTTPRIGGNQTNAGAGLFFTKSIAALSRNMFVLYSGESAFKLLPARPNELLYLHADPQNDRHTWLTAPAWSGTAVGIDVSVRDDIEFANLLDEIRDVYTKRKAYYKKIRFRQ
jgi:anti-sigma regulatory factor (Ser/Thr protein kinase)